jgi:hypothetical protein
VTDSQQQAELQHPPQATDTIKQRKVQVYFVLNAHPWQRPSLSLYLSLSSIPISHNVMKII